LWLSIFGIRGEAYLLGIIELTTAALLAAGAFIPILSALGSLMADVGEHQSNGRPRSVRPSSVLCKSQRRLLSVYR
jgi:hypothetical protein